jgi:ribonuclease Z
MRGSSSVVVRLGRELLMFDCGEGTQRQMVKSHVGFQRPMKIFISHLHGDHVLGLPGLLQSMSLLRRETPLHIYGPAGLVQYVKAFSDSLGGPSFPVVLYEIKEPGVIFYSEEYQVIATPAIHRATAWSYCFIEADRLGRFYPEKAQEFGVPRGELWGRLHSGESVEVDGRVVEPSMVSGSVRPGRKIVYSGDTAPNPELVELSKGADLLIHESTFLDELADRAEEDGHTTALQATKIAEEAGVKQLVLTHISSRYPDPSVVLAEAKTVFENVVVAEDFLELTLELD